MLIFHIISRLKFIYMKIILIIKISEEKLKTSFFFNSLIQRVSILSFHTLGITDSYVTAKHPIKTYCNEKKRRKKSTGTETRVRFRGQKGATHRSSPYVLYSASHKRARGCSITRGVAIGAVGDAILNLIAGKMVVVPRQRWRNIVAWFK